MNNETNIVIASTEDETLEALCTDCATRVYNGVEGVEVINLLTFENLERDAPEHCNYCGVLLEWDMTDDGLEYIRAEIVEWLETHLGLSDTLQAWHDAYGEFIKEGTRFNNVMSAEQVEAILDADTVTEHYLVAQLWTGRIDYMTNSSEFGGEALDSGELDSVVSSIHELPADIWEHAREDVAAFIEQVEPFLAYFGELPESAAPFTAEQVGHDFSLTRNRHGAGFWDRGYGAMGQWLTSVSHAMGERSLSGAVQLDPSGGGDCAEFEWDLDAVLPETLSVWDES